VFSREKAIHPSKDHFPDLTVFIEKSFLSFLQETGLCAGFLCLWNAELNDVSVVVTAEIPIAPFKGTRKESLELYIKDCLKSYPAPHVHSISKFQLWSEIASIIDINEWQPRALFLPAFLGDIDFIFLCFKDSNAKLEVTDEVISKASEVVQTAGFILSANGLKDRVKVMEIYVREIGHDIASSVQAIISKLRNVSRGLIEGSAAIDKICEAEEEIMATYRIADTLGITVDPDYNIGNGTDFNPDDAVREVVTLCLSEAAERHIELRTKFPKNTIELWGDVKGIQSALMQLMMNAIKYARGSSYVTIRVNETRDDVEFLVTDRGMQLNPEDEIHIWKFGWRGTKAKELHVNGSGIGLFTVKKIVRAHGGSSGCRVSGQHNDIVIFFFRIPKRDILKKSVLL